EACGRGGFGEREAEERHVGIDCTPERRADLLRAELTPRGRSRRRHGDDERVRKSPEQFSTNEQHRLRGAGIGIRSQRGVGGPRRDWRDVGWFAPEIGEKGGGGDD